jgi:hypothetical protein
VIVLDTCVLVDALCGPRRSACALVLGARLWTLNPRDFRDLPGLELYQPR